jgi:hypothetical protein
MDTIDPAAAGSLNIPDINCPVPTLPIADASAAKKLLFLI